jgi:hypothetical protein
MRFARLAERVALLLDTTAVLRDHLGGSPEGWSQNQNGPGDDPGAVSRSGSWLAR